MGKTKYKYYDNGNINRIEKLIDANKFEEALACYSSYIEKYPKDINARALYTDILIKLGMFDKAEDSLNEIELTSVTLNSFVQKVKLMQAKLLFCEGKFVEAHSFIEDNMNWFRNVSSFSRDFLFLKKKLNKLTPEDYRQTSYLLKQIVDYSEERCLEHLLKYQYYEENDSSIQFAESFPLKDIYFQLRKGLPEQGRLYSSCRDYKLVFKYDNNGRVNGRMTDYFEVVSLNYSNDIITMYPYLNVARRPYIDITPEIAKIDYPKVKRMSQIDKFNQRYQK